MTGGRSPKRKGDVFERSCVQVLKDAGIKAQRVPSSGAAQGQFSGDIHAWVDGQQWTLECKCRANGYRQLYKALEGRDMAIFKADRREPIAALKFTTLVSLIARLQQLEAAQKSEAA